MKKLVFAIQMIALAALFPVYLVAELNQKTGNITVNNPPSEFIKKAEKTNVQTELNPTYNGLSFSMLKPNNY
jgi:hypothetical protein